MNFLNQLHCFNFEQKDISNSRVYNVLQASVYPNDINWNLKYLHTRKLFMPMGLFNLRDKWETYLPLKTSVSIIQTQYETLISRKQVLLQQIYR